MDWVAVIGWFTITSSWTGVSVGRPGSVHVSFFVRFFFDCLKLNQFQNQVNKVSANSSLAFFCLCPPVYPMTASPFIYSAAHSTSWHCCTLYPQLSLNLFLTWTNVFIIYNLNNPLLQMFIIFFLPCYKIASGMIFLPMTSRTQAR